MESRLPTAADLLRALTAVCGPDAEILARHPNQRASTSPSEFVICRMKANVVRLFCKYAEDGFGAAAGHRGGVAFEAMVYRDVLAKLGVRHPRFVGACRVPETGVTCLFLQALDENARVSASTDPQAMAHAARWVGHFHALGERLAANFQCQLHHYDLAYYQAWLERTVSRACEGESKCPALVSACERIAQQIPRLLERPETIIHGEFYPQNILVEGEKICPVDWESAAVACGEIDLASLTEHWPESTVCECVEAYCDGRWTGLVPDGFREALDTARAYLHLRWIGRLGRPLAPAEFDWRQQQLNELSRRVRTL